MRKSHVLPLSAYDAASFQEKLLEWYGKSRRDLPWRAKKGKKANPYHVWLSEIMLQQTTVPAVIPYFGKFTEKWPDIEALASAKSDDVMTAWAGLGYYARARNLIKCAQAVANDMGGIFPQEESELLKLSGIGPYTAAAIRAIAFNKPAVVVDGNIERIAARVFAIKSPLPMGKKDIRKAAVHFFENIQDVGKEAPRDLPQALMDLGTSICTPTNPHCGECPVSDFCQAYARGESAGYPVRAPRKIIPTRKGRVYWLMNDKGEAMFDRRSDDRMLGGMMGLPTTDWDSGDFIGESHPPHIENSKNLKKIGDLRHTFSHFHLLLEVWAGTLPTKKAPKRPMQSGVYYVSLENVKDIGLPSVFKKAVKIAMPYRQNIRFSHVAGAKK